MDVDMTDVLIRSTFLGHLAATLFMTGVIWLVQVVHYPLFERVGEAEFPGYERRHTSLITWVVGPAMLIEAITGLLLLWFRPTGVPLAQLWMGIALIAVIWLSTALVQVPCHAALSDGFDRVTHRRLVATNWIRTVAWSLRGLLLLSLAWDWIPAK
jgi:uncharacterized membrane protein